MAKKQSKETNSQRHREDNKQRVLTQGVSSMVRSIADAVVIKNQDIFFLAEPDGKVPLEGPHGLGLYYHDCRYLNGYEMKLGGIGLAPLIAAGHGFGAISADESGDRDAYRRGDPEGHAGHQMGTLARWREFGIA